MSKMFSSYRLHDVGVEAEPEDHGQALRQERPGGIGALLGRTPYHVPPLPALGDSAMGMGPLALLSGAIQRGETDLEGGLAM